MKKYFYILILLIIFISCEDRNEDSKLKIKNESFTEITDVLWQGVNFSNNQYENSIKYGTSVSNSVEEGTGYIFFKRKSNPITARTNDLIIIEKNKQVEFTFTDNTLIAEVNNIQNTGKLGAINSTVVWWDDAEGEMQPYYEARSFVGYYDNSQLASQANNRYRPKNGNKSLAIGGTATALLHLKINLEKNAKLSFWYANYKHHSINENAVFSINNEVIRTWTNNINWSFMEIELIEGQNDLIWEKNDGGGGYPITNEGYPYPSYYLSLDDILIKYTE